MALKQWIFNHDFARLYLVASEKGLCGVYLRKTNAPILESLTSKVAQAQILRQAARELGDFFAGKRQDFSVPLDIEGTSFQKEVWAQLRKIPYAETWSYRDLAARVGRAKAFRAVGTANGRNPLSIIVPCHRVIAADGSLGGYSGGLALKAKLLDLERRVRGS